MNKNLLETKMKKRIFELKRKLLKTLGWNKKDCNKRRKLVLISWKESRLNTKGKCVLMQKLNRSNKRNN